LTGRSTLDTSIVPENRFKTIAFKPEQEVADGPHKVLPVVYKTIFVVKPIIVPIVNKKKPTKLQKQWKTYNQMIENPHKLKGNSIPKKLGKFKDEKPFHD
jgi:hypothetical protein